jgi:hypothetical protein
MTLLTLPDYSGTNNVISISALMNLLGVPVPDPPTARAIYLAQISGGAASSRIGGSNVGNNRGLPFGTSQDVILRVAAGEPAEQGAWRLDELFIYAASTDKLSITLGVYG